MYFNILYQVHKPSKHYNCLSALYTYIRHYIMWIIRKCIIIIYNIIKYNILYYDFFYLDTSYIKYGFIVYTVQYTLQFVVQTFHQQKLHFKSSRYISLLYN